MTEEDFSFVRQKELLDELFAVLLKEHSLNEIYKMDILEFLRLKNLKRVKKKKPSRKVDSFFDLF